MIDHLKSMAVFAIVVEEKSFRRAAERLSLSPSVISHHVSTIEKHLGVALIYRSTRSFSLTDDGLRFYKNAKTMLVAAADGLGDFVENNDTKLTQLRVAIPEMLSTNPIFSRITDFASRNTGVQVTLTSSDNTTNLVSETMDVAIRVGRLRDSELKAKKIGADKLMIVAAPEYIKANKKVSHPDDLATWKRIRFTAVENDIKFKKGATTFLPNWAGVAAATDSVHVMHKLAVAALGVAGLPYELVKDDLKSGVLAEVLPDWNNQSLDIFVVWHKNVSAQSVTRKFINHMSKK